MRKIGKGIIHYVLRKLEERVAFANSKDKDSFKIPEFITVGLVLDLIEVSVMSNRLKVTMLCQKFFYILFTLPLWHSMGKENWYN